MLLLVTLVIAMAIYLNMFYRRKNEPSMLAGALPFIGHAHYMLGHTKNLWQRLVELGEKSLAVGQPFFIKLGSMKVYDDCYTIAQNCSDKPPQMKEFSRELLGDGLVTNDPTLTGEIPCNNDQLSEKYINVIEVLKETIIQRVAKFWLFLNFIFKWTSLSKIQDSNVKIINNLTLELLHKMKKLRSAPETHHGVNANSFMEFFVQLENNGLSKREILDEVNTLILASFDTSTLLFSYLMVVVGSYPDVQERLYEELNKHISYDDKNDFEINEVNISKLTFLEAVIKETMRIYTIVPIISRHLDRNINLKNYTLYKGNECILLCHALHSHPMWGDDVRNFKPERWLNPEPTSENTHLFAGFGLGRRSCIGKVYAMMQTKVIMAHVLLNYKISGDHKKIVLTYKFGLEPASGHFISIERRNT